jgi:hypothetical protein
MELEKPIAPVINLNGTSASNLVDEYKAAYKALLVAYEVVQRVTVHGRDFQTAPSGLYEKAREEQIARLAQLKNMADGFMALALNVQDQADARRR